MRQILSVGVDPSLLYTRSLVLEKCGAAVESATPEQALLLLCDAKYELVVLCHSMRDRDVHALCAASRACAGATKVLLVDSPAANVRAVFDVDRRFSLEDGPELLVAVVEGLLAEEEPSTAAGGRPAPFLIARRAAVGELSAYADPVHPEIAGVRVVRAKGDS